MCRVLDVARSGYYAWKRRGESRRDEENRRLDAAIHRVYDQHCIGDTEQLPQGFPATHPIKAFNVDGASDARSLTPTLLLKGPRQRCRR
jgi:hypothetical protein